VSTDGRRWRNLRDEAENTIRHIDKRAELLLNELKDPHCTQNLALRAMRKCKKLDRYQTSCVRQIYERAEEILTNDNRQLNLLELDLFIRFYAKVNDHEKISSLIDRLKGLRASDRLSILLEVYCAAYHYKLECIEIDRLLTRKYPDLDYPPDVLCTLAKYNHGPNIYADWVVEQVLQHHVQQDPSIEDARCYNGEHQTQHQLSKNLEDLIEALRILTIPQERRNAAIKVLESLIQPTNT